MFHCISAISLGVVCYILASRREWEKSSNLTVAKMMGFSPEGDYFLSGGFFKSGASNNVSSTPDLEEYMWEESAYHNLPKSVQRYFHKAFMFTGESEPIWEDSIKMLRSLEVKEEGTLLLKEKWWVPFTGTFHFSANPMNPGYVHELVLSIPSPVPFLSDMKMYVHSALLNGLESRDMKVMKVIPVIDDTMLSDLQSGSLLRWLSLTPLFPTSLLPHDSKGVQWKSISNIEQQKQHSVYAKIMDAATSEFTETELNFDEGGFITSIFGIALKTNEDGSRTKASWEGRFYDYKFMGHGMMVPSRVEFGWISNDGEFEPYYKSTFKNFNYTYF